MLSSTDLEDGARWDRGFLSAGKLGGFDAPSPFDTAPGEDAWFWDDNSVNLRAARSFVLSEEPHGAVYEWVVRFQGGTAGARFGLATAKAGANRIIGNYAHAFGFRSDDTRGNPGIFHGCGEFPGLRTAIQAPGYGHGERVSVRLDCSCGC